MKKNKTKFKIDQRGSALVFTVILLVNAVLISVAITAISIMEKKVSSKTRSSAPAFQEADSGIEWALDKLAEGNPNRPITGHSESPFPAPLAISSTGEMSCPAGIGDCSLYFIYLNGANEEVVTSGNIINAGDVIAVRSVGRKGDLAKEQQVTRALEAHAAPNCPTSFTSIGDFCVENDLSGGPPSSPLSWLDAADFCAVSRGGRLCSAQELYLACNEGSLTHIVDTVQWTGSIMGANSALASDGTNSANCGNFAPHSTGTVMEFRCCRNR